MVTGRGVAVERTGTLTVGVAGALAVGPLLASWLHGTDPADIRMLAAAPVVGFGPDPL
jgi:hypothetical protein